MPILRRLILGFALILMASAVLLGSDLDRRVGAKKRSGFHVRLIEYVNVQDVEEAEKGVIEGFAESGLKPGPDFRLEIGNAQGDTAAVHSLLDSAVSSDANLVFVMSTPVLQAALQKIRDRPLVFTYIASPKAAGAGDDDNHLPNVTGVATGGAYKEALELVKEVMPNTRTVGTIFCPAEVNSVVHRDRSAAVAKKLGMELIAVPASTAVEVPDAALALCGRRPDVICQIPGNMTTSSFPSIANAARQAHIPLFGMQTSHGREGAAIAVGRDYHDAGRQAAHMAARILRGESPAGIPFEMIKRVKTLVNLRACREFGVTVPPAVMKRAFEVIGR